MKAFCASNACWIESSSGEAKRQIAIALHPPAQATARAFIKEIWPPPLGPKNDDVFDINPRWDGI
jgi:hypothetical protein